MENACNASPDRHQLLIALNPKETYNVPMAKTHETPIFLFVVIIDRHIQFSGRNSMEKSEKMIIPATVMYSAD